jgi:RNA polymerase sigma factor (sigma-70 family)
MDHPTERMIRVFFMTDIRQLVLLCKKLDPRAQRELYDRYKSRLMGICRRYAASREEAQDVLQEAFIKIFTRFNQLDDAERLENWMIRITINTAVNFYHQNKRYVFNDISDQLESAGGYELILSTISDEFLIAQINSLPDGCRVVFNLFVVEGYTHAEVAAMLMISESTSRSQLVYAKSLLKEKLNAAGIVRYERYA